MNKKSVLKIVVPVIMVLTIGALWFMSYQNDKKVEEEQLALADFALHTNSIDLDALKKHNLPIIIDFGADECVPCKAMKPVLEKVNSDMQGKSIIKFVDVWKNPTAAQNFPVQIIPTQILINADGTAYMPGEEVYMQIPLMKYVGENEEDHLFTVHQGALTEEQMLLILKDMGVK